MREPVAPNRLMRLKKMGLDDFTLPHMGGALYFFVAEPA
jgi:hypothetical protein